MGAVACAQCCSEEQDSDASLVKKTERLDGPFWDQVVSDKRIVSVQVHNLMSKPDKAMQVDKCPESTCAPETPRDMEGSPSMYSRSPSTNSLTEYFPMYTLSVETLLTLPQMESWGKLGAAGLVQKPSLNAIIHFISHEWLGLDYPDPEGVQLHRMQQVFREILEGRVLDLFEPAEWKAFAEKASTNARGTFRQQESDYINGRLTQDGFREHVRGGQVWLDYASVPQEVDFPEEEQAQKLRELQSAAIHSIPAYLDRCNYFWVCAPTAWHVAKGWCNFSTWRSRGWCRLEEFGNFLSTNVAPPLIVAHPQKLRTLGFIDFVFTCQGKPHMAPCAGQFTCCLKDHKTLKSTGELQDLVCDKIFVAEVLEEMLEAKKKRVQESASFRYLADFLLAAIEPMLLGGSDTFKPSKYISEEETVEEFLQRFNLRHIGEVVGTAEMPFTVWSYAVWLGHVPMLQKLCREPEALAIMQDTSLPVYLPHRAASQGRVEALRLLLDEGLLAREDLSTPEGSQGITPLDRAAKYGFPEMVELLLNEGVKVDPRRSDGSTPLHGAASAGHASCCELLLARRADPHAVDSEGRMPIHLAADPLCFYGSTDGKSAVLPALLRSRADPSVPDAAGLTPLDIARSALFKEGEGILYDALRRKGKGAQTILN